MTLLAMVVGEERTLPMLDLGITHCRGISPFVALELAFANLQTKESQKYHYQQATVEHHLPPPYCPLLGAIVSALL